MKFGDLQLKYEVCNLRVMEPMIQNILRPRGGPHGVRLKMTLHFIFGRKSIKLFLNEVWSSRAKV